MLHHGWQKLVESFQARFEVVPANSDSLRDEVYRVRHRVYCEEFRFERISEDGLERDQYDHCSTSILIRDVPAGEFIACARIVHTNPCSPADPLPFEVATQGRLNESLLCSRPVNRASVGEISRLAVVSRYRRRKGDAGSPAPLSHEDFSEAPGSRFPFILAGLYVGILASASIEKMQRLYLLSEARLATHIGRIGVGIIPIGEPIEYRGMRIPSMIEVAEVTTALRGYIHTL